MFLCLVMYVLHFKSIITVDIKEVKSIKASLKLFPKILDNTKKIRPNQNLSSTNLIADFGGLSEVITTKDWSHRGVNNRTPQRWVVLSLAVFKTMSFKYAFCLPFVVASWKRIGWNTTIMIVGDVDFWKTSPILNLVKNATINIDTNMHFFTLQVQHNPVSYSQVVRLFASLVTSWILPDDILMTSDIDILPLNRIVYDNVNSSGVFILNADCCGKFKWRNLSVEMQPMTSISMTSKNWKTVMQFNEFPNNESLPVYINNWLGKNFGETIPKKNVEKGDNNEWYKDQTVISVQLHKSDKTKYKIQRKTYLDRVDRSSRASWKDFTSHVDAHIFLPAYDRDVWPLMQSLIENVLERNTVLKLVTFQRDYVKLLGT